MTQHGRNCIRIVSPAITLVPPPWKLFHSVMASRMTHSMTIGSIVCLGYCQRKYETSVNGLLLVESTSGRCIPSQTAINPIIVFHAMVSSWNCYAYNNFIECIDFFISPIAMKLLHSSIIKKLIYMSSINNKHCYASFTYLVYQSILFVTWQWCLEISDCN